MSHSSQSSSLWSPPSFICFTLHHRATYHSTSSYLPAHSSIISFIIFCHHIDSFAITAVTNNASSTRSMFTLAGIVLCIVIFPNSYWWPAHSHHCSHNPRIIRSPTCRPGVRKWSPHTIEMIWLFFCYPRKTRSSFLCGLGTKVSLFCNGGIPGHPPPSPPPVTMSDVTVTLFP